VRRIIDAFDKPFRNKATSLLPASQQARAALGQDDEQQHADEETLLAELERDSQRTGNLSESRSQVHQYGSAADLNSMPPPPSTPFETSIQRRERVSSPTWDIELDLNDDEIVGATDQASNPPLDPRLAKKDKSSGKIGAEGEIAAAGEKISERKERSPSPVWDIELDLN
jgi:DNA excision repair protein ERCC-1